MKKYYIGYGLTLNNVTMALNCPNCKLIRKDFLKDYKLAFKGDLKGYLTIEPSEGNKIPVHIYRVLEENIKYLDNFIGCPDIYEKSVIMIKGKEYFTYKTKPNFANALPDNSYFDNCLMNYSLAGFDHIPLLEAKRDVQKIISK